MTVEQALSDASGVATLIGFPLVILALVSKYIEWKERKMIKRFFTYACFAAALCAYGVDIYDRFFVDHKYVFAFNKSEPEIKMPCRDFVNEEILLDNRVYSDCTFKNVTFVYNGTGAVSFSHNKILGEYGLKSENTAISIAFLLFKALGYVKEGVPILNLSKETKIEEIKKN